MGVTGNGGLCGRGRGPGRSNNNNNNTRVSAMRKTSIKIHKLLLMRIELSDMRMGTATPTILTLYPTRLKNYACHASSHFLSPSPPYLECDFEIYAKNVSSRCRKTFACDISLSIKLEISNLTPPSPCLRPYSGHAHKNARQLKNEAAVGDICYLLRFVYITLYLESAMPEQCQAKPSAGNNPSPPTSSPLPAPLICCPLSLVYIFLIHLPTAF